MYYRADDKTKTEFLAIAKIYNVKNRHTMNKKQLVVSINYEKVLEEEREKKRRLEFSPVIRARAIASIPPEDRLLYQSFGTLETRIQERIKEIIVQPN